MKILVIPDIHEAPNLDEVEAAIAAHAPDLTVFLGDYFDSWDDTPADAGRTAEWLANSLKVPKRQHLFGNHDLPYYVPRIPVLGCPGWDILKYREVCRFLDDGDWGKLTLHHWEADWLFTHAGWSNVYCPDGLTSDLKRQFLDDQVKLAWNWLSSSARGDASPAENDASWVWALGRARGGDARAGGLTWCDVSEFSRVRGINQVFGHTTGQLRNLSPGPDQAWVIDTKNKAGVRHCLSITDGVVEVHDIRARPS
jgi:hypothetical protein